MKLLLMFVVFCLGVIYTEKTIHFIRQYDPIMQKILEAKDDYYIEPVNNIVENDYFIPGLNGMEIDIDKSYLNMKQNGIYDDSLLVYSEVILENNYDRTKYITKGNPLKKMVSLIIVVDDTKYLDNLLNLLYEKQITLNFFLNNNIKNEEIIQKIISNDHEINYYTDYNKNISYITDGEYCLFLKENYDLLESCSNSDKISLLPNILDYELLYLNVITELNYGSLILIENIENLTQINGTIDFINQKGMTISTLENHLDKQN